MAKSGSDFIIAMIVIIGLIAVGFAIGNDTFQSSKTEKYVDFYDLDLLNVSGYEVVDASDHNSLKIDSTINASSVQGFILDFGEDLSNVTEYEIEMKVSYDSLVDGDGMQMLFSADSQIEDTHNLSYTFNPEEGVDVFGDVLRNANGGNSVQLSEELIGRFETSDSITLKFKYNTETGYLIKTATSGDGTSETAFEQFSNIGDGSFDVMDNAKLGLYFFDDFTTTNTLSENSTWTIDYVKLTYIPVE